MWQELVAFWLLTLLTAALYEFDILPEGLWVGRVQTVYVAETVSVLLVLACVPLALKLFRLRLARYAGRSVSERLSAYRRLGRWRLCLLALPAWLNLHIYYATLDNIGAFSSLICMTASLFCLPGVRRLKDELSINESKECE